jgi:hypothetical protein
MRRQGFLPLPLLLTSFVVIEGFINNKVAFSYLYIDKWDKKVYNVLTRAMASSDDSRVFLQSVFLGACCPYFYLTEGN